ncbi:MAG: glycosyltransferase family 4 protein [Acidimicrobiia bacterium]|nr:glycosyltransferase family 4 protein [Acidimicrobiia bacterium]
MASPDAQLALRPGGGLRIGLVCPYDLSKPGGVQAQVLGLRSALESGGDEAFVIGPGLPEKVPGWDLGGTVGFRANGSVAPISIDPRVGATLKSVTRAIEVLHVHEPFMPTVGISALRAGPPVVATFHAAAGGVGGLAYRLMGRSASRLLGTRVKTVTAVSPTAAAGLPDGLEPVIVPNGVDIASLAPVEGTERALRVAFLGRDEPRKGLDVLLEAWPRVAGDVEHAELVVMGSDRGNEGIRWMGVVDDRVKASTLGSVAVYVAPNTGGESFGVILVEAMAAGAAVLASNLPAFVDVGGDAIRYFEAGNAESLAAELIALLSDEHARVALARRGMVRARKFDWSRVAADYRDLYASVAS